MIVIGVCGGSGSGKTTFVNRLREALGVEHLPVLPQDAYYRDSSHLPLEVRKKQNYDHPDSIEWELMSAHLGELLSGQTVPVPTYSMLTCTRTEEITHMHPTDILVVEGILIYTHAALREQIHLRVFLDVDEAHRYERLERRDMKQRGRTAEEVRERYLATVAPMYDEHIWPSRLHANLIVPKGGKNERAAGLIAGMVKGMRGV